MVSLAFDDTLGQPFGKIASSLTNPDQHAIGRIWVYRHEIAAHDSDVMVVNCENKCGRH